MSNCIVCGWWWCGCGWARRCSCSSNETLNRRLAVIKTQLDLQKMEYKIEDVLKCMIENNRSNNEEVQEQFGWINTKPKIENTYEVKNMKCEYEIDSPSCKCIFCGNPKRRKDKYASESQCTMKR